MSGSQTVPQVRVHANALNQQKARNACAVRAMLSQVTILCS